MEQILLKLIENSLAVGVLALVLWLYRKDYARLMDAVLGTMKEMRDGLNSMKQEISELQKDVAELRARSA